MEFDLTGQIFGRLTVIGRDPNGKRGRFWICRCECGKEALVRVDHLLSGATRSCGCLRQERNSTHGKSKTPEYRAWLNMKKRCYYQKDGMYHRYGGRGIRVCDRWLNSFDAFYEDMGPKPSEHHSIDRIDPKKNYTPENCRWASRTTQSRNQDPHTNSKTGFRGVRLNKIGRYEVNITHNGAWKRVGTYKSLSEAISARKDAEALYWGGDAE